MNEHSHPTQEHGGSRFRIAFIGFALIAAFFLLFEHRAHVVPYLPFLLLAACPLMHLFGHGHGGHGGHGSHGDAPEVQPAGSTAGNVDSRDTESSQSRSQSEHRH